jgi:hypothetical protein
MQMVTEKQQCQQAISSPAAVKCIQKEKNYTIGQILTCANSPKEVHAQCVGQKIP